VNAGEIVRRVEEVGGWLMLQGDRIKFELPEDAACLVKDLREHREEVLRVLRERERPDRCYIHGINTSWRRRGDGSWLCRLCHPDVYEEAVQKASQSGPPAMPCGVRLVAWSLKEPPVAIESCSVVAQPALFARATLEQLRVALADPRP
jgi:hypothetical protein